MKQQQCSACNGTYSNEMADGSRYFHACGLNVPQGQRRDENPPSTKSADAGKVKSVGLGAVDV